MNTETLKMELATARKAEGQAWAAAIAAESGAGGLRRNRMPENMEPMLAGVHDPALVQRIADLEGLLEESRENVRSVEEDWNVEVEELKRIIKAKDEEIGDLKSVMRDAMRTLDRSL